MKRHLFLMSVIGAMFALSTVVACSDSAGGGESDGGIKDVDILPDTGSPDTGPCPGAKQLRCGECTKPNCTEAANPDVNLCGPGQRCNKDKCNDQYSECQSSSAMDGGTCVTQGQMCTSVGEGNGCLFPYSCGKDGKCPFGYRCFNTMCIVELPGPSGGCLADAPVCLTSRGNDETNTCCLMAQDWWGDGCKITCDIGNMLVIKDPATMSYGACSTQPECECQTYPDIFLGDYGQFSSLVLKGNEVWAAGYSRGAYFGENPVNYGDLIVIRYDLAGGDGPVAADPKTIEFVDGVPAIGTIEGNVKGPRGGITNPGVNVGFFTSLGVASDNELAVAYYDYDNHALKYAKKTGVSWTTHVVDGAVDGASAGKYASMTFDANGKPHIAYFQEFGAPGADRLKSALKLAVATTQTPTSASDWTITIVESGAINCGKTLCAADETCVQIGDKLATCEKTDKTCDPACDSKTQQCVLKDATPVCGTMFEGPSGDVPQGIGLFASLVVGIDGNDLVAYYDNSPIDLKVTKGDLKGASVTAGTPAAFLIDGSDVDKDTGDVGRFASLAQAALGGLGIAYYDATLQVLKYWHGAAFDDKSNKIETVATGISDGEKDFAGPDCDLKYDPQGKARIAYQNATSHELVYAWRGDDATPWPPGNSTVLLSPDKDKQFGTGGFGFFARQRIDPSGAYISNLRMGYKESTVKRASDGSKIMVPDTTMILIRKAL